MLIVFDTMTLVAALLSPYGPAFRVLRLVQGLPMANGVITDITGWEFVRVATDLGYSVDEISEFLDAFDPLFNVSHVAASPISRRLLGNAIDNVSLEDAAMHLTGRRLVDFHQNLPPAIVAAHESRDENDLHVVWAVVEYDADVLCTLDNGYAESIGTATVCGPLELLEKLS